MIFSIRDLSFELGSVLLEGWPAFAARAVCALLILLAAWLVRRWLTRKGADPVQLRDQRYSPDARNGRQRLCLRALLQFFIAAGRFSVCLTRSEFHAKRAFQSIF